MPAVLRRSSAYPPMAARAEYWDRVLAKRATGRRDGLWRRHSDRLNRDLLDSWLESTDYERALKTDLYEEAVGAGLYACINEHARSVDGVDVSPAAVEAARQLHPGLHAVAADVRELPFAEGTFDLVVSTSTLDHFSSRDHVERALAELHRVLRRGGTLVITMDNECNPVIALRAQLRRPLLWSGVLPYFIGVSCDARGLRRLLADAGFEVTAETAILHSPRLPAIALASMLDRSGLTTMGQWYLSALARFEHLAAWRTAGLTGYYVAARAVRG